jgi:hypothetical protein
MEPRADTVKGWATPCLHRPPRVAIKSNIIVERSRRCLLGASYAAGFTCNAFPDIRASGNRKQFIATIA